MCTIAEDGNWSVASTVSFWNVIYLNVGSISLMTEKIFVCAFNMFKFVLPLEGCS